MVTTTGTKKLTWRDHLAIAEDCAHDAELAVEESRLELAAIRAQLATAHALIAQTLARHGRL